MSSVDPKYWLAPHVHVCVTGSYAVLLDLHRDKYVGIAREHLPALAATVVGWPAPADAETAVRPSKALLDQMLSTGMLTTDSTVGKEARSPARLHPQFTAIEADLEFRPRITLRDVSQVLIAAGKARALLKWRPIETVVARVQRRKERHAAAEFDLAAARPLVAAFLYLRPLFFTTKDECLFDSLVLIEVLARHRLFPAWLFGVSTQPFRAHSWVQAGERVLNDEPERISGFTPILVV